VLLTLPKGRAYFQAAFNTNAWNGPPERRNGTRLSFPPTPLSAEDLLAALLDAPVPVDPLIDVDAFSGVNAQMSQEQNPYSGDVDPTYGLRNTSAEPIPALSPLGDVPNVINTSSGSGGVAGGLINLSDPITNVDLCGMRAKPLFHHDNMDAPGGRTNRGNSPVRNMTDINISSLRLRGIRLPPQTYEGDALKLYHRLISEGADSCTAGILRDVIFAAEVTVDALMAPLQTRKMTLAYGGAKRMWQLLLETKEVMPGKKRYFCLLCPVVGRPGYNHDRDAVRHFNREHFGFSFPCGWW
jgi:hypothetical protein